MKKLLIIDDDAVHRMVIARIAKQAHLEVEFAATLQEAAAKISSQQFNCVTLDLNLGESNGISLLGELATQGGKPTVFVISASDAEQRQIVMDTAHAAQLTIIDVPKPIDLKKLRALFEAQSGIEQA